VVTHAELIACGVPLSTVCWRIRRTGPWQRLHPGVVLAHSGSATSRERLLGALAYAGAGAVLTGICALRLYGLRSAPGPALLHVVVPHGRHRQGRAGLLIERSRSVPAPQWRSGLPVAPAARAVVDACRTLERLDDIRELVAEAGRVNLTWPRGDGLESSERRNSGLLVG